MISRVAIIGMGAVGAMVAKNLQSFLGKDNVECICKGDRFARYKKDGILINGIRQDFNYVLPENLHKADLVIIATKNLHLAEILPDIKNAVGENTAILSLLNGIQSEKDISCVYGEEKTLYGFIVGLSSVHEGNNIDCSDVGTIVFGEKDNSVTERIKDIETLFKFSNQKYKNPEDIHVEQWKKFLMNVTCNTTTALCRAPYGVFQNESLRSVVRQAGKEVIAVAKAEGIILTEQMTEDNINIMDTINPKGKTSMFQDVEAKRRTENKWFCGTVVELGRKHAIETPVCAVLEKLIDVTEASWDI
ncbi:MAG: ketopantoate reductase family protein [Treponema sp.]|nr:ketopantoate reductase family protein [Treponema sp.]